MKYSKLLPLLLLFIGISQFDSGQETQSCTKYWLRLYAQGKVACNKIGYIAGSEQGVDCFSTTMDGLPTCCNARCPGEWFPAENADVLRHISQTVGKRHHQRCTNGGEASKPFHGLVRCSDTFTNRRTKEPCKVNPDMQNEFICRESKPKID